MKLLHLKIFKKDSKLEKLYAKSEKSRIQLKKKLYAANRRNKQIEEEVRSNKFYVSLSKILNKDQINLLTKYYKRIPCWCNKTLMHTN